MLAYALKSRLIESVYALLTMLEQIIFFFVCVFIKIWFVWLIIYFGGLPKINVEIYYKTKTNSITNAHAFLMAKLPYTSNHLNCEIILTSCNVNKVISYPLSSLLLYPIIILIAFLSSHQPLTTCPFINTLASLLISFHHPQLGKHHLTDFTHKLLIAFILLMYIRHWTTTSHFLTILHVT